MIFLAAKLAGKLTPIASKRESHCRADFVHTHRTQLGNSSSQSALRNCNRVMQVDCTWGLHAIIFVQSHFRRYTTNRRCDGRNGNCGEIADSACTRQYHHGPALVGRVKEVEPNVPSGYITARYSCGHAASASQTSDSSTNWDRFEYPSRSRSSFARTAKLRRCSRSASRTRAERFRFVRRAAWSVARKSLLSRTI
jgi:hypothetical protein